MDLKLREMTWFRLLSLLLWTVLMMINRGVSLLIEKAESWAFEVGSQSSESESRRKELGTLLPPLTDELVLTRIWPLLHQRVNVSLLWRLRRVNRAWREKVSTTLKWTALEWVRVDSPGFLQLISERRERRPALRDRVESELRNFAILVEEDLEWYSATSRPSWPVTERLGSVRSLRSRRSRRSASRKFDSELSSSSGRSCRRT